MRLLWIFLGLSLLFLIPFLVWGEAMEKLFSNRGAISWLQAYGAWAWFAGIALLVGDLFFPLPGTAVMAALGYIYGPVIGGVIGASGSFLSGMLAYGLCRWLGNRAALRLVTENHLDQGRQRFTQLGGSIIALSRFVPLLAEVVACMAGLTRMPMRSFLTSMACGCLPMGFTFAFVGHAGAAHPALALTLSAVLPPILWLAVQPIIRVKSSNEA